MLRTLRIFIATALVFPLPSLAAHPLVTDDTGTQGDGHHALELNAELGRDRADGEVAEGGAAAILSMGAGDAVDLVIGVPASWSRVRVGGTVRDESAGANDATLELKWRFLEREGFSLAVKPGLSLPTGDPRRGLGAGSIGYGLALIATQAFGPVALHFNGAFAHNDHELATDRTSTRHQTWHASAAATAEVVTGLQLVANLGVQSPGERSATTWPAFALVGAVYSITDRIVLDLGVRTGLNAADTDLVVLAGAAYRFGGPR
jgi:hypothetical protein